MVPTETSNFQLGVDVTTLGVRYQHADGQIDRRVHWRKLQLGSEQQTLLDGPSAAFLSSASSAMPAGSRRDACCSDWQLSEPKHPTLCTLPASTPD